MKSSILLILTLFSIVFLSGCMTDESTDGLNLVEGSAANNKIKVLET